MAALDVFVGRDGELARLVAAVDRARTTGATAVLVAGEPGIGKSRLVDEGVAAARRAGGRVLRGDATEQDRSPFALWHGIERALGIRTDADDVLPASERRWEVLEALEAELGRAGPAVVVLEDLHWADDGSIWVLERLPRQLEEAPVAFVATTRVDEPGVERLAGFRRQATTIDLAGLDGDAVAALVAAVRPGDRVDAEELRDRTGGNPLFVHEVLVTADDDRMSRVVSDVLGRSLDRLGVAAQEVLGVLALAGAHTPPAVLAAAAGMPLSAVQDAFDEAVGAGILRRSGRGLAFRHALLAEAARSAMTSAARSEVHLRLAAAWAAADGSASGQAEAAGHLVAALPAGNVDDAAAAAVGAIAALRAAGDHRRIADLSDTALLGLDAVGGAAPGVRTTLALARASALEAVGEEHAAIAAYAVAADLARDGGDLEQRAVAEVGACTSVNPFMPHVERLARLRQVEAALPAGDSLLRVGLLRRAAVLQCSSPGGPRAAIAEGDAAVAMARRLGDPEALVDALSDRHFIPLGREGFAARAAAGAEIVELGDRLGRPHLALRGCEWTFGERLERGDLAGAIDALERLEAYAHLMPSPWWRWAAVLRRVVVANVRGDHAGAMAAIERAAALAPIAAEMGEALGLEQSNRVCTTLLWGIDDPAIGPLHERLAAAVGHLPVPFFQVMLAMDDWVLGNLDAAAATLARYAGRPELFLEGVEGSGMVVHIAAMAADLGMGEHAAVLRAAIEPFAGLLGSGNGTVALFPVDTVLGRLALLEGDATTAVQHHRSALALVTAMPSPTLAARCGAYLAEALDAAGDAAGAVAARTAAESEAARVGLVLPPAVGAHSSAPPPPGAATMQRSADGWVLSTPHGHGVVADSTGMRQLARLVAQPGVELAATDLAGLDATPVAPASDLGPMLDATAKRAYRRRIGELQADIDEAEANHDTERVTLAQLELDALLTELRRAVGLGGRDRPSGSDVERARVNVTRSLKRAVAAVSAVVPDLGAHLDRSLRTGRHCAYAPEPAAALTWEIVTEPAE